MDTYTAVYSIEVCDEDGNVIFRETFADTKVEYLDDSQDSMERRGSFRNREHGGDFYTVDRICFID